MPAVALLIALLIVSPAQAGEYETRIAIALELAAASDGSTPATPATATNHTDVARPAAVRYTTRQVTKYRMRTRCVTDRWGRKSCRTVRVPYTVTVPTTPPLQSGLDLPTRQVINNYPLRGRLWSGCRDYRHLLQGEHAKYRLDPAWLREQSNATIQSIHSDLHENVVRRDYLVTLP